MSGSARNRGARTEKTCGAELTSPLDGEMVTVVGCIVVKCRRLVLLADNFFSLVPGQYKL